MKNLKGLFGVSVFALFLVFPLGAKAALTTDSATLNGSATASVDAGSAITASVTATVTGANDWRGTKWVISTSTPGSMTCVDTTNYLAAGTYVESFSITAPILTGVYNVFFQANGGSTCIATDGNLLTMSSALTVRSGGAASAIISADATTTQALSGIINLTITLRDQYGNLVSDNTSVTLDTSLGTVGGTGNSVNGVITRTLQSDQAGTATLNISGLTMSGDTSIIFDAVPVPAPAPVSDTAPSSQPVFVPSGRRNPPVASGGQVLGASTIQTSVDIDPKLLSDLSSVFSQLSHLLQQQIALLQAASRN
jgi:hypothetical protein